MSTRQKKTKNKPKQKRRKHGATPVGVTFRILFGMVKIVLIVCIAVGIAGGGLMSGIVYGYLSMTVPIQPEQLEIRTGLTSYIYDVDENLMMELTGSRNINRIPISYDQMPKHLEHAIIAIEDERFYDHFGIDIRRIASSVVSLVQNRGRITQGGSTITQQVVKHITDSWDNTPERKVQEWYNAILLERRYDKRRILTLYANVVNQGNGCYGVQAAANFYFGKDVSSLTIAESAVLAAIPNAPAIYNPATESGMVETIQRKQLVLDKMLELGFITETEYKAASSEELQFKFQRQTAIEQPTTYFTDHVLDQVIRDLSIQKNVTRGMAESMVYNNGYRIYTTMDPDIQKIVDRIYLDPKYFPTMDEDGRPINPDAHKFGEIPQSGIVIIDPFTGYVRAMYGGSGEKIGSRTYNRATQARRQPGSAIKPIAIYAPAIDLNLITPATIIDDIPVYLDEKNPEERYPTNYTRNLYRGLTSVRDAIKSSVNVVAAVVWYEILGHTHSIDYMKRIGIDRENEIFEDTVSVAMGGLRTGISPLEMAGAYTPFINNGIYSTPITYTRVVDIDGNVVLDNRPQYSVAYSEETAFLMRDMMTEVVKPSTSIYGGQWGGAGTAYGRIGIKSGTIEVAGKTGTTSDNLDKWFVGFSPYYVAAVWYGYDNRIRPVALTSAEYNQAMVIWNAVMEEIHIPYPATRFPEPPGNIIRREVCIFSGRIATDLCRNDPRGNATRMEYFVIGTEPAYYEECNVHVQATICTNCQDQWGRYLPPSDDCDDEDAIEERVFIVRPVPWMPGRQGEPMVEDFRFTLPEETCSSLEDEQNDE